MADYRRHFDDGPRRPERDPADRLGHDAPGWFRDGGMYRTDDRAIHDRYRHEHATPPVSANGFEQSPGEGGGMPAWLHRERGGYWRQYESIRPNRKGLGPKDYGTADSLRASGPGTASSQPVTQASGKGTPSNSTSSSTA